MMHVGRKLRAADGYLPGHSIIKFGHCLLNSAYS